MMDTTTVLYNGYFIKSAIDRAKELIGRLDQDDQRTQLDLIENSLETYNLEIHGEATAAAADEFNRHMVIFAIYTKYKTFSPEYRKDTLEYQRHFRVPDVLLTFLWILNPYSNSPPHPCCPFSIITMARGNELCP